MAAAEKKGIPFALLMPNRYQVPTPGIPPIGSGLLPTRDPLRRLHDMILNKNVRRLFAYGLPMFNSAREQLGLDPLKHPFEQFDRAARVLVLTSQAFDFKADTLPPNVRYVGPQLDDPLWTQRWDAPWPADHPAPLVVVSFSTTYQHQEAILQKVIDSVDGMGVRTLVTLGSTLRPELFRLNSGTVLRKSVPHSQVFCQATAVVTHAGHGTVTRALASGVPLVCIPMGRDQDDNAARVVARGAGLRLSTEATVSALREAIQCVLKESKFRSGAYRLAQAINKDVKNELGRKELETIAEGALNAVRVKPFLLDSVDTETGVQRSAA